MNMNRVLEVGRNWLGVMALALCLTGSARAQVGALVDQPGSQETEGNVVIWVNNTESPVDDVMPIGGSLPCTINLTGATQDMSVVLVAPKVGSNPGSTRLSLYKQGTANNSDGSLSLTLLKSGAGVEFSISGVSGSMNVGDGKIEAHKGSAAGDVKQTEDASVYWFQSPHMFVTQGAEYKLDNLLTPTMYEVPGTGVAVNFKAQLILMPLDVPTNNAQLANVGVSFVQNVSAIVISSWTNPVLKWTTQAVAGDTVTKGNYTRTIIIPNQIVDPSITQDKANDTSATSVPLYTDPVYLHTGMTVNDSNDTPTMPIEQIGAVPIVQSGRHIADITFQKFAKVQLNHSFTDWCVTSDVGKAPFQPFTVKSILKENSWALNVDSSLPNQKATVDSDHSVTSNVNLSTNSAEFATTLINNPNYLKKGFEAYPTTTWTK